MIRRPPRSTLSSSSAASDVYKRQAGMSADAYSRITGKLGLAVVTAGPGSINVVNGLVGGWTDSAPMMVISGQSALSAVEYQEKSGIRQYGVQGLSLIHI